MKKISCFISDKAKAKFNINTIFDKYIGWCFFKLCVGIFTGKQECFCSVPSYHTTISQSHAACLQCTCMQTNLTSTLQHPRNPFSFFSEKAFSYNISLSKSAEERHICCFLTQQNHVWKVWGAWMLSPRQSDHVWQVFYLVSESLSTPNTTWKVKQIQPQVAATSRFPSFPCVWHLKWILQLPSQILLGKPMSINAT